MQQATESIARFSTAAFDLPVQTTPETPAGIVCPPVRQGTAPGRHVGLLRRVFGALVDPDGYEAGLRRLDDDLRKRGPSQFARFYIEELLGRSPETGAEASELVLAPSRRIREILLSNEFMSQHDIVLQREFSHLSREFFFHIPKSGGTTVVEAFASDSRFCPLYFFPGYNNGGFSDRLAYLRNRLLRLTDSPTGSILMIGHPSAKRILMNKLKRGGDHAFTILRDPIDNCLSWINYVFTQLQKYPNYVDVIRWRNKLGLPARSFVPDRTTILNLVPKIVELIAPNNPMCGILGLERRLESVLECVGILDLKIIPFGQLDDYIRYRGVARYKRMNVSTRYVELSDLDRRVRLMMYDKNSEDIKVYDWVGRHMSPGDGPWFEL